MSLSGSREIEFREEEIRGIGSHRVKLEPQEVTELGKSKAPFLLRRNHSYLSISQVSEINS